VSPPPAPPPLPAATISRLAERFHVTNVTKAAAPASAPAKPEQKPVTHSGVRYAHFRDAESRFPPDVFSMLREGMAPWKAWRLHKGLRGVDVCNVAAMSSSRLADLENTQWKAGRPMVPDTVRRLSEALDVPVVDLVPDAVLDHPMLDRSELDRREREYEDAERALAKTGDGRKAGTLYLRKGRDGARPPRVDIVGLHPRETNECRRSARDLPLSLRFMTFDEFQRATPSSNVVVFQKGVPHAGFNVAALKAKGTTVRYANGGVSSVLDMLRAVIAAEATSAAEVAA
jgi:hypothetical protein